MNKPTFRERLDATDDEAGVRDRIARGLYHSEHLGVAQDWLRGRAEARAQDAEARRESREEQALALARENADLARISADAAAVSASAARSQATWAKWAAVVAIVAAIFSAKDEILALLGI